MPLRENSCVSHLSFCCNTAPGESDSGKNTFIVAPKLRDYGLLVAGKAQLQKCEAVVTLASELEAER